MILLASAGDFGDSGDDGSDDDDDDDADDEDDEIYHMIHTKYSKSIQNWSQQCPFSSVLGPLGEPGGHLGVPGSSLVNLWGIFGVSGWGPWPQKVSLGGPWLPKGSQN